MGVGGGVGVDPRKPGKEGWRKWPISTQELRCDDYVGFGVGWWNRIYCILLLAGLYTVLSHVYLGLGDKVIWIQTGTCQPLGC